MQKTLDEKLARISADSSCKDFILADAKDADMAYGLAAPGLKHQPTDDKSPFLSIQDYRAKIRQIVEQRLVDIMLMSVSTSDALAVRERLFETSPITPAIRANDTSCLWLYGTQAVYGQQPSRPFRTAIIDEAIGANANGLIATGQPEVNLGLYSITFNNDVDLDHASLCAFRAFREEAWKKGFRYFLEVFPPNAPANPIKNVPRFVNDSIVRLLAGAGMATRPLFLKIPYFGPAAMEQLASYDSSLVVGILGGSAGTTFDAFQMLWEAKKHGARVALFGRKINTAEHQLSFVEQLRALADGNTTPAEAVKAYHGSLKKLGIAPTRSLAEDSQPQ
ncbi:MAG TPA: hypothetical protein VHU84_09635 [Lacipirellulaceae bacterium]|nr:hypothetical protein [Lacipirellulaceae bacterium]